MTKNICYNCKFQIVATPENPYFHTPDMKSACASQIRRKIEQSLLTSLIIFGVIALGGLFATGQVWAQQEIQLLDGGGVPIILPNQSPTVITTLKAGEFIHGTVSPASQVSSNGLQNFMVSNSSGQTTFQGMIPTYQSNLDIGSQQIVIIPASSGTTAFGLTTIDEILVGGIVVALIVVVAVWRSRRQ